MRKKKITVAFDVDDTLITSNDVPKKSNIALYKLLQSLGCDMYIWSRGGVEYALENMSKLGLSGKVVEKGSFKPDFAVDDMEYDLGKHNIMVKGFFWHEEV